MEKKKNRGWIVIVIFMILFIIVYFVGDWGTGRISTSSSSASTSSSSSSAPPSEISVSASSDDYSLPATLDEQQIVWCNTEEEAVCNTTLVTHPDGNGVSHIYFDDISGYTVKFTLKGQDRKWSSGNTKYFQFLGSYVEEDVDFFDIQFHTGNYIDGEMVVAKFIFTYDGNETTKYVAFQISS